MDKSPRLVAQLGPEITRGLLAVIPHQPGRTGESLTTDSVCATNRVSLANVCARDKVNRCGHSFYTLKLGTRQPHLDPRQLIDFDISPTL